jgi:ribosomal protein S18 acetylase RimI-like enzyme
MEIREADARDSPAIRDVARRSLQASYSLDATAITAAIEEWYDDEAVAEKLADDEQYLLVATVDGQVVGFSESYLTDETSAQLRWLHVDPNFRGAGYGARLYDKTRTVLAEDDIVSIEGRVLADNADGNAFYREQGLSRVGEETIEIDGQEYTENVYADTDQVGIEAIDVEGETRYVHYGATDQGSQAPFYTVYTDEDTTEVYGYLCGECGSPANAMGAMGGIECDECGNKRKPTRWDAAYL